MNAIQEAQDISFEYLSPGRVDLRTARELAYIEYAARITIEELYGLIPPTESPEWLSDALNERTAQVHADIDQVKAETGSLLQQKELEMQKIEEANGMLDSYFLGSVSRTSWGYSELLYRRGGGTDYDYDETSERARTQSNQIYREINQAYGEINQAVYEMKYKGGPKPEPRTITLFDNSDDSDIVGGRQGADVLLAFRRLNHGFARDEVLDRLHANFKTEDGVSTTSARMTPYIHDDGPTSSYIGGYDPNFDVDYTLRYERTDQGTQKATLEISTADRRRFF